MKRTFFILAALVSMMSANAQNSDHNFSVAKNLDIFNSLYRQLDVFYVDTLNSDEMIRIGIDAMLESLDPYTEYYPEEDMGDLKMMTTGKYGGIGSVIRMRKDSTVIIHEPYAGMPAAEVGLKVGDVLKKIDDKDLTGMSTSEVSNLLRGEPGTTFLLRVMRPGETKARDFKITRKNIKVSPIPYSGLIGETGFISFTQFTEGCAKEIRKNIISLKEKGAKNIIIDLRGNGGGLLNEAVDIVNLFVPKGLKIVETRGKITASERTYETQNEPLDLDIPLAILVNGQTASAAEILSGSLQDLDRAIVVGSKTFGKGLVQSPRELPFNGSIKLTTAKYYIPSGRCIQAIDYKKKREQEEVYRKTGKKMENKDSINAKIFHTAGGREVTEGSGIMPDVVTKRDTMANVVAYISLDDVLIDWGTQYCQKHATIAEPKDFNITDADFAEFKQMLKDKDFKYDRLSEKRLADLKKTAELEGYYEDAKDEFAALEKKLVHNLDRELDREQDDIRKLMANEVIKRYYFQAGQVEQSLKGDKDIEKAIEMLSNTAEYKKILEK